MLGRHASSGRDSNAARGIGLLNLGLLLLLLFGEAAFASTPLLAPQVPAPPSPPLPPSPPSAPSPPSPAPLLPPPEAPAPVVLQVLTPEERAARAQFLSLLSERGLQSKPVPSDNNSFFASVASQLENRSAVDVRTEILQCMQSNEDVCEAVRRFETIYGV